MKKHNSLTKRYINLMQKAATIKGRKEAVSVLHKAEKLRLKISTSK